MAKKKTNNTPVIEDRKVHKVGNSLMISIPESWLKQFDIGKGDEVTLVANNEVRINPKTPEVIESLHKLLESWERRKKKREEKGPTSSSSQQGETQ